jgi:hypothetical protein
MHIRATTGMVLLTTVGAVAQGAAPAEFGAIRWQRDFAAARASAAQRQKPVLLLFQEVPG